MTDPILQVGDEFLNGQVVVASAYPNGDLKVVVYAVYTGPNPNDYLTLTVSPATTVGALRNILAAIGVTLP